MRRTWWIAAAYAVTVVLGGTLALQRGGASAVPAVAPIGGEAAETSVSPPVWEFVRLAPGAVRPLLGVLTLALGGYAADLRSAVASVFPGMPAR